MNRSDQIYNLALPRATFKQPKYHARRPKYAVRRGGEHVWVFPCGHSVPVVDAPGLRFVEAARRIAETGCPVCALSLKEARLA